MEPQVRYVRAPDDVRIAYWAIGEGPILVQTPLMPYSHIEMEWQNPYLQQWYLALGEFTTVVRYDGRGTGLSSREVDDLSLEAQTRDLGALIDALGAEPVSLLGVFHSGPAAISYAATHPDRISHLMLWCTYARGTDYWRAAQSEGLRALRQTDYRLFLRTAAHELLGWADDEEADRFSELMAASVTTEIADRLIAATRDFDVTEAVSAIVCPTLVMHRRDLHWIDVSLSRNLASEIPDAMLTVLDGRSPLPGAGDIEGPKAAIARFLDVTPEQPARRMPGSFRAVLFTDLVEHTQMMAALGDERGRQVLREHEGITREVLAQHGGTELKAMGDGFMASFNGVTNAVECAVGLQRRLEERNTIAPAGTPPLSVRIGVNAGEPIEEDGDLFGATVILAARIAAAAGGGEILVSNSIRELSAGKRFRFVDRGTFDAKGYDEPVRIWSVDWS